MLRLLLLGALAFPVMAKDELKPVPFDAYMMGTWDPLVYELKPWQKAEQHLTHRRCWIYQGRAKCIPSKQEMEMIKPLKPTEF